LSSENAIETPTQETQQTETVSVNKPVTGPEATKEKERSNAAQRQERLAELKNINAEQQKIRTKLQTDRF